MVKISDSFSFFSCKNSSNFQEYSIEPPICVIAVQLELSPETRRSRRSSPPVKKVARFHEVETEPMAKPVGQVEEAYDTMRRWSSDFMITAGFHVLPSHAVTIPRRAALNFHPSALDVTVGGWSRVEHSKGGAVLVSNEKDPGCLVYIGDYTTQLYREHNKPL